MGAMWLKETDVPAARGDLRALAAALASLDKPGRDAIILRYCQGFSPEKIARMMGISANELQTLLQNTLNRLQTALMDKKEEESP